MILKTVFAFATILLVSCGSSEKSTKTISTAETTTDSTITEEENIDTMDPQKLMAEGYMLGTIVYSDKEGECPYTIQMPGDKMEFYYLDPINLDEKYKKDGLKVWIKFNGLRMMNRCDNATPAEITAIRKGE